MTDETARLLARYLTERSIENRNALAESCRGLVIQAVQRRRVVPSMDLESMEQVAQICLLQEIPKFDPERGVPFPIFVATRLHFCLMRYREPGERLGYQDRHHLWLMTSAWEHLVGSLQRMPTRAELAAEAGIEVSEVEYLEMSEEVGIQRYMTQGSVFDHDVTGWGKATPPVENTVEIGDLRNRLAGVVESLDDRQRAVLALYTLDELSYEKVGEAFGYSAPWAVAAVTDAIRTLRSRMEGRSIEEILAQ